MSDPSDQSYRIVQFVHPGFEYRSKEHVGPKGQRSGVMEWKAGRSRHDRKFVLSPGSIFDPVAGTDETDVPICFWGEWEGPSVFWKLGSTEKPDPSVLHSPFRPAVRPTSPVQNTDPMVFEDAFIYSNCMQGTYRILRTLTSGSIVLFGRFSRPGGRPAFGLDTCLVVDRIERLAPTPFEDGDYGVDLLEDSVLKPLYTEGAREDQTVYFGRRRNAAASGPFSFVPAKRMFDEVPAFARPELRPIGALAGVVSPGNMQGIKGSSHDVPGRDEVWAEVVRQIAEQGCGLGYHAAAPPLLDDDGVHAARSRYGQE